VPPGFKRDSLPCPRCGTVHEIPAVAVAAAAAKGKKSAAPAGAMTYRRKGSDWESFRCSCGKTVQLSPTFSASQVRCPGCKKKIAVTGAKPTAQKPSKTASE
jgi:hypothetical protein